MSILTYPPRHANLYDTGRNIYQQGVHSYEAVYIAIRRLGYYLMCGDEDIGLSSVQNDEERTKIIYDILTKNLKWSGEYLKNLWQSILSACKWRPTDRTNMTKKTSDRDTDQRDVDRKIKKLAEEQERESNAKGWKPNKNRTSPNVNIDSTNSTKEIVLTSNTIYNYSEAEKDSKEEKPLSKEEVRSIFKSVLGEKIDFGKTSGMMNSLFRAVKFKT